MKTAELRLAIVVGLVATAVVIWLLLRNGGCDEWRNDSDRLQTYCVRVYASLFGDAQALAKSDRPREQDEAVRHLQGFGLSSSRHEIELCAPRSIDFQRYEQCLEREDKPCLAELTERARRAIPIPAQTSR